MFSVRVLVKQYAG